MAQNLKHVTWTFDIYSVNLPVQLLIQSWNGRPGSLIEMTDNLLRLFLLGCNFVI